MSETESQLAISWSVSRGRETYGYNICRLDDVSTGKRYRCNGGGYDMQGTVFGEWLQDRYQDRLSAIRDQAFYVADATGYHRQGDDKLYGMTRDADNARIILDGACGMSSMESIAKEIGLTVHHVVNRRGNLTALIVADTRA